MASKLTIRKRIENSVARDENTLNLSFRIVDIESMMKGLGIKETDGTDQLAIAIVKKILNKNM